MASRPTRKTKYGGDLAAPIRDELTETDQGYRREVWRKLELLYQHYGITGGTAKERAEELAVALALAHVPGFSVKSGKQPGRPTKWTEDQQFKLLVNAWNLRCDLEKTITAHKITDQYVINKLSRGDEWRASGATLYRRYGEAKSKWGAGLDGIRRALRAITKRGWKRIGEIKAPEHHGALPPPRRR